MFSGFKLIISNALSHKGFRRYFANTSWLFGEQILRIIAGLLVGIWVARYLGPEQFGLFSYATAFVAIFSSIAKLGLDGIVVRDLVDDPNKRDIYLGTAFWLKLIGAFSMLVIIAFATIFTSNDYKTNLYIYIIASGIIFQSFEVIDFYFQSKVLSKFVSMCKIAQLLISSIVKIYLVLTGADLLWFFVVSLIDQITLAVTLYITYKHQRLGSFYNKFDCYIAKKMLNDSWPLILTGLVIMIYLRIDQIIIKELLGEYELGIYSAAIRLSEIWYSIPILITSSLFPAVANAKKISEELYIIRLQRLYTFMIWTAVAIALPMTLLSDWLVVFLYGEAYRESGTSLMILIWGGVFVFLGVAFGKHLMIENLTKKILHRNLLGLLINILLNFILIKKYGLIGSAIASITALIITNYIYDFFDKDLYSQLRIKTLALTNPIKAVRGK